MNARELRDRRGQLIDQANTLIEATEAEDRDFNPEEQQSYDDLLAEAESLRTRIERLEARPQPATPPAQGNSRQRQAPAQIRNRGDSEVRALAAYVRDGDRGAVRDFMGTEEDERGRQVEAVTINIPTGLETRAVVDSIMNITTAADGGALVPTGFAGQVAARRNEVRLAEQLGVRMIPGVGTTVEYPYENADPVALAATAEQDDEHAQTYGRDTPVLATKQFTLAKKTKKIELTEELLDDEDAALMNFLADHMGRAMGITHNGLLLTEVAAYGTALKTFASASAIADGEPEDIVYNDTLGYYLDDGGAIHFVMRPSTFGSIKSLSGDARIYGDTAATVRRTLLEYPVSYSNQAAAIAASAKSVYFGNFYYVGMRESPALRIIRDPYSVDGLTILKYSFRACYGVLIAGAVGYGVHPSA